MYFYYHHSGYIPPYQFNSAYENFQAEIRSFFGACIALQLIFCFQHYESENLLFTVFQTSDGKVFEPAGTISGDIDQALSFALHPSLETKYRSLERLSSEFKDVCAILNSKGNRLKTAATWIFRAEARGTLIDRVLETTIALEVLLGDRAMSDKIGLTKLMSNRVAFSLAKSDRDREVIMSKFDEFYGLRSQIVHTGKLALTDTQEELVEWASDLASNMLRHELTLLAANAG